MGKPAARLGKYTRTYFMTLLKIVIISQQIVRII